MDLAPSIKPAIEEVLQEVRIQIPALESFAEAFREKLVSSFKEVAVEAVTALADGVGQIVHLGESLDRAYVDLQIDPIVIPAIKARATVHIPIIKES